MVRPKKHLGQHFLKDGNIARKITACLDENFSVVCEIGPGTGILTQPLLDRQNIRQLTLIEIDTESVKFLQRRFSDPRLKILEADFLKCDPGKLFDKPFALIGNFPYNISSQIFFKVLENRNRLPEVVGMIQKEVAERLTAPPGSKTYGILSVLLQAWYDIEYCFTVNETVFFPPPKVKSAVIRLRRNETEKLNCDENLFFQVVKTAFGQRRKTLRNALKSMSYGLSVDHPLLSRRAEQLTVADFITLTQYLSETRRKT
jgi:16S rRNA (adenine1518-N6/adenine1519-N6)-dimethyltransferase